MTRNDLLKAIDKHIEVLNRDEIAAESKRLHFGGNRGFKMILIEQNAGVFESSDWSLYQPDFSRLIDAVYSHILYEINKGEFHLPCIDVLFDGDDHRGERRAGIDQHSILDHLDQQVIGLLTRGNHQNGNLILPAGGVAEGQSDPFRGS